MESAKLHITPYFWCIWQKSPSQFALKNRAKPRCLYNTCKYRSKLRFILFYLFFSRREVKERISPRSCQTQPSYRVFYRTFLVLTRLAKPSVMSWTRYRDSRRNRRKMEKRRRRRRRKNRMGFVLCV